MSNKKFWRSLQIGAHASIPGAQKFDLTFQYPDDHPTAGGETKTYSVDVKPATYIMGEWGLTFNMMRFNRTNGLAFTTGLTAYGQASEIIDEFRPNNSTKTNLNFLQISYSVPLCIAYKFGGEVSQDKIDRFSFTLGYGLMPTFSVFNLSSYGDLYLKANLRMVPVVYSEIGFFAGIEWKIKAALYPQGYYRSFKNTFVPNDYNLYGETVTVNYTNRPMLELGLVVMPFSFRWSDARW